MQKLASMDQALHREQSGLLIAAKHNGRGAHRHSALTIENALIRHLDDLLVVMYTYPQVYVDIGALSYALPHAIAIISSRRLLSALVKIQ